MTPLTWQASTRSVFTFGLWRSSVQPRTPLPEDDSTDEPVALTPRNRSASRWSDTTERAQERPPVPSSFVEQITTPRRSTIGQNVRDEPRISPTDHPALPSGECPGVVYSYPRCFSSG